MYVCNELKVVCVYIICCIILYYYLRRTQLFLKNVLFSQLPGGQIIPAFLGFLFKIVCLIFLNLAPLT